MRSKNVNYCYVPLFPLPYLKNFSPTITEQTRNTALLCNMTIPFLMGFVSPADLYLIIPGDEIFDDTIVGNVPGRVDTYTHAKVQLQSFNHRSCIQ